MGFYGHQPPKQNGTPIPPPRRSSAKSETLKPCPFCGSKAKLETGEASRGLGQPWHKTYDVICSKRSCICHPDCPKVFTDKNEAIEAWNMRH